MKEYRLYINSEKMKNQTSHNLNIQLDREFNNCVDVKLVNIILPYSFYNITKLMDKRHENIVYIYAKRYNKWIKIPIKPGLYNFENFFKYLNSQLKRMEFNDDDLSFHMRELLKRDPCQFSYDIDENSNKMRIFTNRPREFKFSFRKGLGELFGIQDRFLNTLQASVRGETQMIQFSSFHVYSTLIDESKNFEVYGNSICNSDLLTVLPLKDIKKFGSQITYNLSNCDYKPCKSRFNGFTMQIRDDHGNEIDLNNFPVVYELVIRCKE